MEAIDLVREFMDWNLRYFGGILPVPEIRYNSRLSTTAGRFISFGRRKPPVIEVASYLLHEPNARDLIRDTLGHEMIHYWLWFRRRPYGHTAEFHRKMQEMGVSRYNTAPKVRPFKHQYVCDRCEQRILVRRRLKGAACARCCSQYASGYYSHEFRLRYEQPAEGLSASAVIETTIVELQKDA